MSFSLAQRKELKETFTLPRPPLKGRMQSRDLGKPQIPPTLFAGRDDGLFLFISNTMLKHRGVLPRGWGRAAPKARGCVERALSERGDYLCPDERRLEIYFYGGEPGGF